MGGFCLFEDSDVDLDNDNVTEVAVQIYENGGVASDYVQNNNNRFMQTYRLSASQFTAMETAWDDYLVTDASFA